MPALAKKVDLAVGVDLSFQMEREMKVQQGGRRTRTRFVAIQGGEFSRKRVVFEVSNNPAVIANGWECFVQFPKR